MFVTVDKHKHFKSFISNTTFIRLKYLSSNAAKLFLSNFKLDDYFFKLGYDVFSFVMAVGLFASQQSIV